MSKIEASVLSDIKSFFSKLSNAVVKGVNTLIDWGVKISDMEELEDGSSRYVMETPKGNKIQITYVPVVNTQDTWNVTVKSVKGGKSQKYTSVKGSDIGEAIVKAVNKLFGEDMSAQDLEASRKITVTLQRVCAATGDTINLTSVSANYNPVRVLEDLDTIVSDDNFVGTLTEVPTSFEITDTGDEFDVAPLPVTADSSLLDTFTEIFKAGYRLHTNLQCIHWNAKGQGFHVLHQYTSDYYYSMNWQLDQLAEWFVEYCGHAPHPATLVSAEDAVDCTSGYDMETGLQIAQNSINEYIAALELYYCNLDKDIQSIIDGWIRDWKSRSHYTIERTLLH